MGSRRPTATAFFAKAGSLGPTNCQIKKSPTGTCPLGIWLSNFRTSRLEFSPQVTTP